MAGDWIPVTIDLVRRREVAVVAEQTGLSRHEVVGMLVEFWGWASGETEDGVLCHVSVATLSRTLSHKESYYRALCAVGWIREEGTSLVIVNWDRWLSNSAKARLGNTLRQKMYRGKKEKTVAPFVATKARPEKRREENIVSTKVDTVARKRAAVFVPPSADEVKAYCTERGNAVDAEQFVDHYTARAWKFKSGQPVKDWRACVRTWEKNSFNGSGNNSTTPRSRGTTQADLDAIEFLNL